MTRPLTGFEVTAAFDANEQPPADFVNAAAARAGTAGSGQGYWGLRYSPVSGWQLIAPEMARAGDWVVNRSGTVQWYEHVDPADIKLMTRGDGSLLSSLSTCGSCNLSLPGDDALCWHCGSPQIHQGSLTFTASQITVTSVDNYRDIENKIGGTEEFKGNSMSAKWDGDLYTVKSYSTPIAHYHKGKDQKWVSENHWGQTSGRHINLCKNHLPGEIVGHESELTSVEASYKPRSRFVPNVTNAVLAGLVEKTAASYPDTDEGQAGTEWDYPEGTTATCRYCGDKILLDKTEGGGAYKDWGSDVDSPYGLDYGCGDNPISDDEGTGGHSPEPGTISIQPDTRPYTEMVRDAASSLTCKYCGKGLTSAWTTKGMEGNPEGAKCHGRSDGRDYHEPKGVHEGKTAASTSPCGCVWTGEPGSWQCSKACSPAHAWDHWNYMADEAQADPENVALRAQMGPRGELPEGSPRPTWDLPATTTASKTASKTVYISGKNMVGYMPEADNFYSMTFEEAKAVLVDDMIRDADSLADGGEEAEADQMEDAISELHEAHGPEWGAIVGNMSYWIQTDETDEAMGQDDLDQYNQHGFTGSLQTSPTGSRVSGMTTTTARYLTATEDDPEPPKYSREPTGYADTGAYSEHYEWVRRQRQKEIETCRHCKSARTRTGKPDAVCGPHRNRQRLDYYTHPASETYWTS